MSEEVFDELVKNCIIKLYKEAYPSYLNEENSIRCYLPTDVLTDIIDNYIEQYNIPNNLKTLFTFFVTDKAPCTARYIVEQQYDNTIKIPDDDFWKIPTTTYQHE